MMAMASSSNNDDDDGNEGSTSRSDNANASSNNERLVRQLISTASEALINSTTYALPIPHWATPAATQHPPQPNSHRQRQGDQHGEDDDGDHSDDFMGLVPFLQRAMVYAGILVLLMLSATVLYFMLYLCIVPIRDITTLPLHFDYTGISNHPTKYTIVQQQRQQQYDDQQHPSSSKHQNQQQPRSIHEICATDQVCQTPPYHEHFEPHDEHTVIGRSVHDAVPSSHLAPHQLEQLEHAPWATADLFARHTQWEHFYSSSIPKQKYRYHALQPKQPHYIEVHLTVPQQQNHAAPNAVLGLHVELHSTNGTLLGTSMRSLPMSSHHKTKWIGTLRQLFWLCWYMFVNQDETMQIQVPSFHYFMETTKFPLRYITVRLLSSSPSTTTEQQQPPIMIYDAAIKIGRELTTLQYILKYWYYTSFSIGVMILTILQCTCWMIGKFIIHWYREHQQQQQQQTQQQQSDDPSIQLELDENDDTLWESTIADQAQNQIVPASGDGDNDNDVNTSNDQ